MHVHQTTVIARSISAVESLFTCRFTNMHLKFPEHVKKKSYQFMSGLSIQHLVILVNDIAYHRQHRTDLISAQTDIYSV
jgi:hypothetical protein